MSQLRNLSQDKGLSTMGSKYDIIERLKTYDAYQRTKEEKEKKDKASSGTPSTPTTNKSDDKCNVQFNHYVQSQSVI